MKAVLEINSATVRVFADGAEFGDPFEFSVFIVGDEDTAILKGLKLDHRFTVRHKSALLKCLLEAGFKRMVWHRWKRTENGPVRRDFVLDTNPKGENAHSDFRSVAAA
jgi:hypothetical protein